MTANADQTTNAQGSGTDEVGSASTDAEKYTAWSTSRRAILVFRNRAARGRKQAEVSAGGQNQPRGEIEKQPF
jgi:hypothetical protein